MSDNKEKTNEESVLYRQGKISAHLCDLQKSVDKIDAKVDIVYKDTMAGFKEVIEKCDENSRKHVQYHQDTCPMVDKMNEHLIEHSEKEKYKKEFQQEKEKEKSNKISWFKWIVGVIISVFSLKFIWDHFIYKYK